MIVYCSLPLKWLILPVPCSIAQYLTAICSPSVLCYFLGRLGFVLEHFQWLIFFNALYQPTERDQSKKGFFRHFLGANLLST